MADAALNSSTVVKDDMKGLPKGSEPENGQLRPIDDMRIQLQDMLGSHITSAVTDKT